LEVGNLNFISTKEHEAAKKILMSKIESMLSQAVALQNSEILQRRRKFEKLPSFLKAGLFYLEKFYYVRRQPFFQKYIACTLLKSEGGKFFRTDEMEQSLRSYEQVTPQRLSPLAVIHLGPLDI